jgi:Transcription factor WhiB
MNAAYANLLSALHGVPHLPDAACTGRWELMEDVELPDDALEVCAGCPALETCDAWARAQPENSLHGVVGGASISGFRIPARDAKRVRHE